MTNEKTPDEAQQIWRDALGRHAEGAWQCLSVEPAPALVNPVKPRPRVITPAGPWAALAASVVVAFGLGLTVVQQQARIDELTLDNALLSLQSTQPWTQLQALSVLRAQPSSIPQSRWPELMSVLQSAQDPNIQLATLEILVSVGAVRSAADLPNLEGSSSAQQAFLQAAYQEQHP